MPVSFFCGARSPIRTDKYGRIARGLVERAFQIKERTRRGPLGWPPHRCAWDMRHIQATKATPAATRRAPATTSRAGVPHRTCVFGRTHAHGGASSKGHRAFGQWTAAVITNTMVRHHAHDCAQLIKALLCIIAKLPL